MGLFSAAITGALHGLSLGFAVSGAGLEVSDSGIEGLLDQ